MTYTQYGPWTDGSSPGIAAEFLNPLETFLLSLNSAAYDTHVSSDGSGNATMVSCHVTTGKISRISNFTGTGAGTFSHGLGATPATIQITYAGNFGSPPTHPIYYYNANSTTVYVQADSGYFWTALALTL